jgi:hypothetical protein
MSTDPSNEPSVEMQSELDPDSRKARNNTDFWLGVGLFFVMNYVLWQVLTAVMNASTYDKIFIIGALPLPINIAVIIYLARKRSSMAGGMVAGIPIGFLLLLALVVFNWASG